MVSGFRLVVGWSSYNYCVSSREKIHKQFIFSDNASIPWSFDSEHKIPMFYQQWLFKLTAYPFDTIPHEEIKARPKHLILCNLMRIFGAQSDFLEHFA